MKTDAEVLAVLRRNAARLRTMPSFGKLDQKERYLAERRQLADRLLLWFLDAEPCDGQVDEAIEGRRLNDVD